jgi:Tol biopolymer transport system component
VNAASVRLRIGAFAGAVALVAAAGCAGNDDEAPTGSIVVFGSPDVLLVPAAGGKPERFRIADREFWDLAFSDDGSRVAFNPAHGLDAGGITVMTLKDGRTTVIPNQPPQDRFFSYDIAWAPDEQSFAFVNGDGVFAISIDGSDLRKLGRGSSPNWTPNGEHVVFASGDNRGDDFDIVVVRADGTDPQTLGRGTYPDVSPSGDEVAYSTPTGILVQPLMGGTPRLVVPNGFGPVWSPDGQFLAFTRYTSCPRDGDGVCSGRVFVVAVEGGEPRAAGPTSGDPPPPRGWIP